MRVGWHNQFLSFEDPQCGASIDSEFADIQPLLEGSVYIFWKNVFGYDMIIGYGADTRAISEVKAVLRQIGYNLQQADRPPTAGTVGSAESGSFI